MAHQHLRPGLDMDPVGNRYLTVRTHTLRPGFQAVAIKRQRSEHSTLTRAPDCFDPAPDERYVRAV
jgi:hypothetical protein